MIHTPYLASHSANRMAHKQMNNTIKIHTSGDAVCVHKKTNNDVPAKPRRICVPF